MKGKILIAELKHLLDDCCPNNLLGAYPIGSRSALGPWAKVLHRQIVDGSTCIQNAVDGVQFNGPRMIQALRHQRHLFFAHFAHFVVALFLCFDSIFNCLTLLTYYHKRVLSTMKCAFFIDYKTLCPWMGTT